MCSTIYLFIVDISLHSCARGSGKNQYPQQRVGAADVLYIDVYGHYMPCYSLHIIISSPSDLLHPNVRAGDTRSFWK